MIEKTLKRLTEALNEAEDAEFEMLKQEVSNLTDENEHTQAVLAIADYYNLIYYVQKFKEIKDYQDSPQYQGLTLEQSKERLDLVHKMFDELEKSLGKEKALELYRCL